MSTIREVSRRPDCTPSWSQVAASSFRGRRLLARLLERHTPPSSGRSPEGTSRRRTRRRPGRRPSTRRSRAAGQRGPGLFNDLDLQLQELHNRVASVGIGLLIGHQSSPTRFRNEAGYGEISCDISDWQGVGWVRCASRSGSVAKGTGGGRGSIGVTPRNGKNWDFLALAAEPGGQSGQFAPQRRRVARQQPQRNT